ncbi:hypothetical protein Tco_0063027 [Tanacetum coccineum]
MKEDPIEYPNESKDDGEDSDDEPSDDDDDDDDTDDEDEEPTEDKEEEEHLAPTNFFVVPVVDPVPSAGDTEAFETDESTPTPRSPQTRVLFYQTHLRRAHKTVRLEPPIRFVLTAPPPGCDVAESSAGAAARPPRAADKAKDVGYVRALQASEHRMMTSIEEVNLRVSYQVQVRRRKSEDFYKQLHDAQTDRRDIRLKIDIVRGQRTAYEIELHEVLEARARIDTVEDTGSSC